MNYYGVYINLEPHFYHLNILKDEYVFAIPLFPKSSKSKREWANGIVN